MWVLFNDTSGDFRQLYISKIIKTNGFYRLSQTVKLDYDSQMTQKNWIPFQMDGKLNFVYWMDPYTVLQADIRSGECHKIVSVNKMFPWNQNPWAHKGHIRGGSPAIFSKNIDAFVTFFHSSRKIGSENIYYMGAATFKKDEPYTFTKMSSNAIVFDGIYEGTLNPKKIVFPAGIVENEDSWLVSYGVNDDKIQIAKIYSDDLIKSLHPTQ